MNLGKVAEELFPYTLKLFTVPAVLLESMKKPRSLRPYIERVPFAVDEIPSSVVDTAAVELKLIRPPLIVRLPRLPVVANRLVEEAVVAKLFVVVAAVPVAFTKVKFWSVEEPVTRRLPRVPRPVVVRVLPPSERAPVMVVAPRYALVAKRLVEEAVVAKKFVEVAFVVVEFPTLRSERVEDENTMIPPPPFGVMSLPVEVAHLEFGVSPAPVKQAEPVDETRPEAEAVRQPEPVARKRFEVEAVFVKRVVEVALVVVERVAVKKPRVPMPRLKFVPKKLVELAVVAKKLVVVAFVPVAFREKMKSVVEASPLSVTWKSVVEALSVISNTRAPVALVDAKSVKRDDGVEVPIATRVSFNPPAPLELPHTVRTLMSSICAEYD